MNKNDFHIYITAKDLTPIFVKNITWEVISFGHEKILTIEMGGLDKKLVRYRVDKCVHLYFSGEDGILRKRIPVQVPEGFKLNSVKINKGVMEFAFVHYEKTHSSGSM